MVLESIWVEEGLAARGAHQPHPQVHFANMCMEIVAWEIDGPSLQPSTQHQYTHLMPPSWMQRGCIWVGMAFSEAGGATGETAFIAWSAGSETSGPVDSWGGRWEMVAEGVQQTFLWGGGAGDTEECNIGPLRSP